MTLEMPDVATVPLANGNAVGHDTSVGFPPSGQDAVNGKPPSDEDAVNGNPPSTVPEGPRGGRTDWIDASLIGEALGVEPSLVTDIHVKPAVAAGDNYLSCMWRVRAVVRDGSGETVTQLIVKAPPKGELMQNFVETLGVFHREIKMLSETFPRMRAIAMERCGPDHALSKQLGPLTLPCSLDDVLIMEDLSVAGFRNKERQKQLDMDHCELAAEILARLHALSIALYREDCTCMDTYGEPFYHKGSGEDYHVNTKMHTEKPLIRFAEQVDTWEQTKGKQFGEKCRRLAEHILEDLEAAVTPKTDGVNVLNHGDFWNNNIMYLYDGDDTENPKDVRMVDLQLVRYASQVLDLQYFVMTSAQEQVREEHLDDLLQHYCDHFNEYVLALGHADAQRSFDDLKQEYVDKAVFGFAAVYTITCAVVAEPEDRLQVDGMTLDNMEEVDFSSRAWAGKNFQRIIPKILDQYVDIGLLR